mmetsp:Transcript_51774/g.57830  ORF Transcript_51774/g.57830 Transcript_51774/m.57830 type:complete len:207 (+) Transcript_51774:850-1470(+)
MIHLFLILFLMKIIRQWLWVVVVDLIRITELCLLFVVQRVRMRRMTYESFLYCRVWAASASFLTVVIAWVLTVIVRYGMILSSQVIVVIPFQYLVRRSLPRCRHHHYHYHYYHHYVVEFDLVLFLFWVTFSYLWLFVLCSCLFPPCRFQSNHTGRYIYNPTQTAYKRRDSCPRDQYIISRRWDSVTSLGRDLFRHQRYHQLLVSRT